MPITIEMTGRGETRFWIKSPGKLTLQGSPENASKCILLDISATGIGLVTKESLPVNEIVVLETELHLVLAKVRHCGPQGDGFSVGAERIHTVSKLADASESEKIEQRRALIQEFQSRTPAEIPAAQSAEPSLGGRSPEISEALVQSNWQSNEVSQRLEFVQFPPTAPIESSNADLTPPQATAGPAHLSEPAHEAEKSQPATLPAQVHQEPVEPDKADAEPIEAGPFTKSWRIPLGIAATVVVGLLVFGLHQNNAKPDLTPPQVLSTDKSTLRERGAAPEQASVSPPIVAEHSPTEVEPAGPSSVRPASVNDSQPQRAVIRAIEPSWLTASSDGKQVFQRLLAANETLVVEFSEEAVLHIGNAGGVEISLDGKPIGPLGERGKYRTVELSRRGVRFLPGKN